MTAVTNHELYLRSPEMAVRTVDELRDVNAGMYPAYYMETDDRLRVSTSAAALIASSGAIEPNDSFRPPEWLAAERKHPIREWGETLLWPYTPLAIKRPYRALRDRVTDDVDHWYPSWETIDRRVHRLRPFETVRNGERTRSFEPTTSLTRTRLIERSVAELTRFINGVERQFPTHHHVISMGGKDSQLISLVPKVSDRWHVFSAEPNAPLVEEFLDRNDIDVGRRFHHDNENEETPAQLRAKLRSNDLYSNPRHLRWLPKYDDIAERFDGKVIFWNGTEADALYSYHPDFDVSPTEYFELHFSRASSWQGMTHAAVKNYTGAPLLSPYHSESIWENVYRHYDPSVISPGDDLRDDLGERLHGEPVWWPDESPTPDPYTYGAETPTDLRSTYLDAIREQIDGIRPERD